jgi:hypothetical protein
MLVNKKTFAVAPIDYEVIMSQKTTNLDTGKQGTKNLSLTLGSIIQIQRNQTSTRSNQ